MFNMKTDSNRPIRDALENLNFTILESVYGPIVKLEKAQMVAAEGVSTAKLVLEQPSENYPRVVFWGAKSVDHNCVIGGGEILLPSSVLAKAIRLEDKFSKLEEENRSLKEEIDILKRQRDEEINDAIKRCLQNDPIL
jgi:hypothetical protein